MFIDEIELYAKAGDGGDGVVRWRHEKFKPKAGPAGGNGGRGGDVYVVAVHDLNKLAKYSGDKKFYAEDGEAGRSSSQFGKNGADIRIELPVGSKVTDVERGRSFELLTVGEEVRVLKGGTGGHGNESFKSSTNRSPSEATKGRPGEAARLRVEVSIIADVGLIGMPNAGKSSLLNTLTTASARVGAYPFTTLDPHLGTLFEFTIADIPGLIAGASKGKGLGDKFLRHVERTKMLLHLVSAEHEDPLIAYHTIRDELSAYSSSLVGKEEWIILSKSDVVNKAYIESFLNSIDEIHNRVFVISTTSGEGVKNLADELVKHLRDTQR